MNDILSKIAVTLIIVGAVAVLLGFAVFVISLMIYELW